MVIKGIARINNPKAAGAANNTDNFKPQFTKLEYSLLFFDEMLPDKLGKRIVLKATPRTPTGNSIKRSA